MKTSTWTTIGVVRVLAGVPGPMIFNCDGMHVLEVRARHRKLVITVETGAEQTG
jgi:hypothetical protein